MRDEMASQITRLLTGFVDSRNKGLRERVSQIHGELRAGGDALGAFADRHAAEAERVMGTAGGLVGMLQEKELEGSRIVENGVKVRQPCISRIAYQ
jgi:hypothetical protein